MGSIFDVDNYFKPFEAMNDNAATAMLMNPEEGKPFNTWIRLAAYIASRIARNPDAEFRMAADEALPWPQDRRGVGYVMTMQRISAAVLRTRWAFLISNDEDFVINDRGFVGLFNPVWNTPGLLVPLRRRAAVMLGGGPFVKQIVWDGFDWRIGIPSFSVSGEQIQRYNALSWASAREEAYASSAEALLAASRRHSELPEALLSLARGEAMFAILGIGLKERVQDELLLHRLVNGLPAPEPGDHTAWTV